MEVFYRKYRPQSFSEIVNQKTIVLTIQNAIKMGQVAHAYLFAGPRGTGKTTLARILAKTLNCQSAISHKPSAKSVEPCNKCQNCQEITKGMSLALVEIDAASNRGIDEIRELNEAVRFTAIGAKYRVVIVDEAHQLTKEAFNALLKTLEEPPEHVIFVLATTEPEKFPATILSRVQRFDFKKLSVADITERLKLICQKEVIKFEEDALRLIAINSGGGLRDAESFLAQVSVLSENKITFKEVEEILGLVNFSKIKELVDFIIAKNAPLAVKFINKAFEDGWEIHELTKTLIGYLRRLILLKTDEKLEIILLEEATPDELKILKEQAIKANLNDLIKLASRIIETQRTLFYSFLPILPLEIVIIETLGVN